MGEGLEKRQVQTDTKTESWAPAVGSAAPQKLSLRTERQGHCIPDKEMELSHTDKQEAGLRYTAGSRRWV